jgi:hypothetical protein
LATALAGGIVQTINLRDQAAVVLVNRAIVVNDHIARPFKVRHHGSLL